MRARPFYALLAFYLAGCAATTGSCELLALKSYDRATEQKILSELEAAPANAAWPGLLADYVALRDEVKACKGDGRGK